MTGRAWVWTMGLAALVACGGSGTSADAWVSDAATDVATDPGGGAPDDGVAGDPGQGIDATGEAGTDAPPVDATDQDAADAPTDDGPSVDGGQDATSDADDAGGGEDAGTVPEVEILRVMSFNLRTAFGDLGDNAWENRVDLAAQVIRDEAPQVIGVQEAWWFQLEDLVARLPEYAWVGISRAESDFDEFCAVMYRRDIFEVTDTATITLSDTPEVFGSKFSDAQAYPRILTWARLRHLGDDREWVAFNTHWDYIREDEIPQRSAALTARTMAQVAGDTPAFLTGDFNTGPDGAAWRILTGAETFDEVTGNLIDLWIETETPESGTYHGFKGTSTGARIDWILRTPNGFKGVGAAVIQTSQDGLWPSDHFPVTADLDTRVQPPDER